MTKLGLGTSPVSHLPTSLVKCSIRLGFDFDFSPFTNLTSLSVRLQPNVRVTFPTALKRLCLKEGQLDQSNIADVVLESFKSGFGHQITREVLETLPKTLKRIEGTFEPQSLKESLSEMFPLLESLKM